MLRKKLAVILLVFYKPIKLHSTIYNAYIQGCDNDYYKSSYRTMTECHNYNQLND